MHVGEGVGQAAVVAASLIGDQVPEGGAVAVPLQGQAHGVRPVGDEGQVEGVAVGHLQTVGDGPQHGI